MLRAEQFAVALIESGNDEWYIVGDVSDIQRLSDAGAVSRAWDIKLDNGHRPYAVLKKRINFSLTSEAGAEQKNSLTVKLSQLFGLSFSGELHDLTKTYLLRRTPAFWSELNIAFADDAGVVQGINPSEFYAVYQGYIIPHISGVKFVRREPETISKAVFPDLS